MEDKAPMSKTPKLSTKKLEKKTPLSRMALKTLKG
jgi:hypothetical protein